MDLTETLVWVASLAGGAGFCAWRGAAAFNPLKPRLIPYRLLMVLLSGVALIFLVHLVNLLGVRTGEGRSGF